MACPAAHSGCPEIEGLVPLRYRPLSRYETDGRTSWPDWQERCRADKPAYRKL